MRELQLGMDLPSVTRLLDFLEALFNGGSDFNEPLRRCLDRLTDAKWANSDILLVSGAAGCSVATQQQRMPWPVCGGLGMMHAPLPLPPPLPLHTRTHT